MKEPSSYAALGGGVVGIGVLISQPVVIIIGIVGGAAGFLLKEKRRYLVMSRWIGLVAFALVLSTVTANAADTVTSATVSSSTVVDKTPPTASSPSIVVNNNDICQVGTSGALQTGLFGVSGGTNHSRLELREDQAGGSVFGMGLKVAALASFARRFVYLTVFGWLGRLVRLWARLGTRRDRNGSRTRRRRRKVLLCGCR